MKLLFILVAALMISCQQDKYDRSAIEKEISSATNQYNKAWESLNIDSIASFHSHESFVYYWHGDIASTSNDHFKKIFTDILSPVKSWTIRKTSEPIIQVINKESAIISFTLESESILKDGNRSTEAGALSYVWKKTDEGWKIIHIHDAPK